MKIKEGFRLMDVCGESVIVASGMNNIDFSKVIKLNDSAADIWNAVKDGEFSVEDMAKALTDNYEVDYATALKDAKRVAQEWTEIGMIE